MNSTQQPAFRLNSTTEHTCTATWTFATFSFLPFLSRLFNYPLLLSYSLVSLLSLSRYSLYGRRAVTTTTTTRSLLATQRGPPCVISVVSVLPAGCILSVSSALLLVVWVSVWRGGSLSLALPSPVMLFSYYLPLWSLGGRCLPLFDLFLSLPLSLPPSSL